MALVPPPSYSVAQTFGDIDDLEANTKHWNLDFRQLERGSFQAEIHQFGNDRVHLSEARFSKSLDQRGDAPIGLRTIAVPARSDLDLVWRGQSVCGNSLMVFPRAGELSSVSDSSFHVFTCSFPEALLAELADDLKSKVFDRLPDGGEAIRCPANLIDGLRDFLHSASGAARCRPCGTTDEGFADAISMDLPRRILQALSVSSGSCAPATNQRREDVLLRAERFIALHAHEDIVVEQISEAARVSVRTLEYAFKDRFGLSPKAFLRSFRLNQVRRELSSAEFTPGRIGEIANRWGFWHMGQFAADYQRQFGELPSQKRRRSLKWQHV